MMRDPGGAGGEGWGRVLVVLFPGTPAWPLTTFLRGLGATIDVGDETLAPWPEPVGGQPVVRVVSLAHTPSFAARLANDGVRVLLLIRDPRDAAGAGAALDHAHPSMEAMVERIGAMWGWRDHPGALVVRYEDYCSPACGGDEARQIMALVTLAAGLGWRGSGFRLVRAILDTHATTGEEDRWSLVGRSAEASPDWPAEPLAALQALALAWGYAASPPPAVCSAQGTVGGLLAALANEHENDREALARLLDQARQDAVTTRTELRKVEDAARLVQRRLDAERSRFRSVRVGVALTQRVAARVQRLFGRH